MQIAGDLVGALLSPYIRIGDKTRCLVTRRRSTPLQAFGIFWHGTANGTRAAKRGRYERTDYSLSN
jgi:hypothetical protein